MSTDASAGSPPAASSSAPSTSAVASSVSVSLLSSVSASAPLVLPTLANIVSSSQSYLQSLDHPLQFSFSDSARPSRSKRPRSRSSALPARDRKLFRAQQTRLEERGEILIKRAIPKWIDELNAEIKTIPPFYRDPRVDCIPCPSVPLDAGEYSDSSDDSSDSDKEDDAESSDDEGSAPARLTFPVPTHPLLLSLLPGYKKRILSFLTAMQSLKIDIQLRNPELHEGGSLIFESQQEILKDLDSGEQLAWRSLDKITSSQALRAKILGKCLKYPGIEDYRETLHTYDERRYVGISQSLIEIRNTLLVIRDKMEKNEEQIKGAEMEYLTNWI